MKITSRLGDEGLGPHEVRRRLRSGEWEKLRRGAYLVPGEAPDDIERHRLLIESTMPLLVEGSVLSHLSAGVLLQLPIPTRALNRVTVLRDGSGQGRRTPYLHLRRDQLPIADVDWVDGRPMTTLNRTVTDLARTLSYERAVMVTDHALARGGDRAAMATHLLMRPGRRGNTQLRKVLDFADPLAESPGESLARIRMAQWGIPTPQLQYEVRDGARLIARCDFAWPELGILGEFDGDIKYGRLLRPGQQPQDAIIAEKRREDELRSYGWQVARWCWSEAIAEEAIARSWRRILNLATGIPPHLR